MTFSFCFDYCKIIFNSPADEEEKALSLFLDDDESGSDFEKDFNKNCAKSSSSEDESDDFEEVPENESEEENPSEPGEEELAKFNEKKRKNHNYTLKQREKLLNGKSSSDKNTSSTTSPYFKSTPSTSTAPIGMPTSALSLSESSSDEDENDKRSSKPKTVPSKIKAKSRKTPRSSRLTKPKPLVHEVKKESSDDDDDIDMATQLENLAKSYSTTNTDKANVNVKKSPVKSKTPKRSATKEDKNSIKNLLALGMIDSFLN